MQYLGKCWLAKNCCVGITTWHTYYFFLVRLSINRMTVTKKRKLKYTFGTGMSFQNPCSKDIEKEKYLFGKILRCYRDQYNSDNICKYSDLKQERSFDPSNSASAVLVNKRWIKQLFKMLLTGVVSALTLYLKHLFFLLIQISHIFNNFKELSTPHYSSQVYQTANTDCKSVNQVKYKWTLL